MPLRFKRSLRELSLYCSINPVTERLLKSYPSLASQELQGKESLAERAFLAWRGVSLERRLELLKCLIAQLRQNTSNYASLITQEMGKPITQAEYEIGKSVRGCEFYLENAARFLKPEVIPSDAGQSYIRYDPLGAILGIMPWNFPFWQVIRFAVPTLLAGNVVLLKHAPNVPGCALALERLFLAAGFPKGVFQALFISHQTTQQLIGSPSVQGVSLTGSDRAGSAVAMAAGQALKKAVLELGGSDPLVVFADADLAQCVPIAVQSRMLNTGQSCIAAKRMIVVREVAKEFTERLVTAVQALKVGDPMDPTTVVGPLAREDLRDNLERQVKSAVRQGAKVLCGGRPLPGKGFFYQPTVLQAKAGMTVTTEEVFGPVATLLVVKDEAAAIRLANETLYGLGASLWTRDLAKAERWVPAIEAGSVFVNGMVKSDPRLPFGGIKRSGFGRELSAAGIREFTNVKTVWIS